MNVPKTERTGAVAAPAGEVAAATVIDNVDARRFELSLGKGEPAIAAYVRKGKTLIFNHTVVPDEMQGKGVASKLIKGALEIVRQRGEKFVAVCSYVQAYVEKHPEVRDLLG